MKIVMKCYHLQCTIKDCWALTLSRLTMEKLCLSFMFQDENGEGDWLSMAETSLRVLMLPFDCFQFCPSLDFKGRGKSLWFGNLNWISCLQLLNLKILESSLNFLSLAPHIRFVSWSCPLYLQNISMLQISHHFLWEHLSCPCLSPGGPSNYWPSSWSSVSSLVPFRLF